MLHIIDMIERRLDGRPAHAVTLPLAAISLGLMLSGALLLLLQ